MAITPTTNLSLNMYSDGDNAGAGATNSSAPTNTGLNGNWHKLDALVGGITTTAGVILPNKVTTSAIDTAAVTDTKLANNSVVLNKISSTATDTTSIEVNAGVLRIKDNGVTSAKINTDAVTSTKILDGAVTSAKIGTGTILSTNIASDNTKTKSNFVFTFNGTINNTSPYFKYGEIQLTSNNGIPMTRAGSITKISATIGNGNVVANSVLASDNSFAVNSILSVKITGAASPFSAAAVINGTIAAGTGLAVSLGEGATVPVIVNVEVEYD